MGKRRNRTAAALLLVEVGIAVFGAWVYYGLTAEYGDIADSPLEGLRSGFSAGPGGMALTVVGVAALVAAATSPTRGMRRAALLIPVGMVGTMLALTPMALHRKLETQYDATPQCVPAEDVGAGPGRRAARESQRAFDSIEHVGHFGGGGASGVGGCDRSFVLTEPAQVLQHYRVSLAKAGWRVVEDDSRHLRAERDGMAFAVVTCGGGGIVWAGRREDNGAARCDSQ